MRHTYNKQTFVIAPARSTGDYSVQCKRSLSTSSIFSPFLADLASHTFSRRISPFRSLLRHPGKFSANPSQLSDGMSRAPVSLLAASLNLKWVSSTSCTTAEFRVQNIFGQPSCRHSSQMSELVFLYTNITNRGIGENGI